VGFVLGAGKTDVVREKDAADCMLVSTDGISSKQKFNLVLSTIFSGDGDSQILESISKLLPIGGIALSIGLHVLFVFSFNGYPGEISIFSGSPIADKEGAQEKRDGLFWIGGFSFFVGDGFHVELDHLSYFLIQSHCFSNFAAFRIVFGENVALGHG
jgi:hypothetical protein